MSTRSTLTNFQKKIIPILQDLFTLAAKVTAIDNLKKTLCYYNWSNAVLSDDASTFFSNSVDLKFTIYIVLADRLFT